MQIKRIIIIGTMAFAITMGGGLWSEEANANTAQLPLDASGANKSDPKTSPSESVVHASGADTFLEVLGASSDEQVVDALYNGQSLAAIAAGNDKEVQPIIDLQVAQLTQQLNKRLAEGSIPLQVYQAQLAELPDIVARSVHQSSS
jgi:hypothetical protein